GLFPGVADRLRLRWTRRPRHGSVPAASRDGNRGPTGATMSPQQDDQGSSRQSSDSENEATQYGPARPDRAQPAAAAGPTNHGQAAAENGDATRYPDPHGTHYPAPPDPNATHYEAAPPASPPPPATPTPARPVTEAGRPAPRTFAGYELLE